jgi:hypothetical protein
VVTYLCYTWIQLRRLAVDEDAVEVSGLGVLLDDDPEPPVLELGIRARQSTFRCTVLAVEEEWALNVRDERGVNLAADVELWATQAGAILGAMLVALDSARSAVSDRP